MKNTSFNKLLSHYVFFANQLAYARGVYAYEKEQYRKFAKTENQLGKPGEKQHYEPPLTMNPKSVILKSHAEKCKEAKDAVKYAQRHFEIIRRDFYKQLQENGLTIWYEHGKQN